MKTEIKTQAAKTYNSGKRWALTIITVIVLFAQLIVGTDIVFGTNIPEIAIKWSAAIILAGAIIGFACSVNKTIKK